MLTLPLFAFTLTLAPTGAASRVEISGGGSLDLASWSYSQSSGSPFVDASDSVGGGGSVGLNVYLQRVIDDDAPPALQPFLQYASYLHVDGGAGGYSGSNTRVGPTLSNSGHNGYADVSFVGYFDRMLYVHAGLGVDYRSDNFPPSVATLELPVDVTGGARFGALRVAAGWTVTPKRIDDQPFHVDFWGSAYVQFDGVVRQRLSLGAIVQVLDGGAYVDGGATLYLARRFGVGAYLHGSHSTPNGLPTDRVGTGLSFQAWVSSRVALSASYSFDWYRYGPGDSGDEQLKLVSIIALQATIRPH